MAASVQGLECVGESNNGLGKYSLRAALARLKARRVRLHVGVRFRFGESCRCKESWPLVTELSGRDNSVWLGKTLVPSNGLFRMGASKVRIHTGNEWRKPRVAGFGERGSNVIRRCPSTGHTG